MKYAYPKFDDNIILFGKGFNNTPLYINGDPRLISMTQLTGCMDQLTLI